MSDYMFECENCSKRTDEPDWVFESHGERVECCPFCHGNLVMLEQCKVCGEWEYEENVPFGVCDKCMDKHSYDIDMCIEHGSDMGTKIEVNDYFEWFFGKDGINQILEREIRKINEDNPINNDDYISNNTDWFAKKIIKEKENDRF